MKRLSINQLWLKVGFGLVVGMAATALFRPQAIHAYSCSQGSGSASSKEAGLIVKTQLSDGTPVAVNYTINDLCSSYGSIVKLGSNGYPSNFYKSLARSTGGNGQDVFPGQGSNTWGLDCRQVTGFNVNNARVSYFSFSAISNPAGHPNGHWSVPTFNVQNGVFNLTETMTWYDDKPATALVQGWVYDNAGTPLVNVPISTCIGGLSPLTDANGNWSMTLNSGQGFCASTNNPNSAIYQNTPTLDPSYSTSGPPGTSCNNPGRYDCQQAGIAHQGMNGLYNYDFIYNIKPEPAPAASAVCTAGAWGLGVGWQADGGSNGYTVEITTDNNRNNGFWYYITGITDPKVTSPQVTINSADSNVNSTDGSHPLPLVFNPGTTYYVDVFYNSHGAPSAVTPVTVPGSGCLQGVQGRVFNDLNGNGVHDPGEPVFAAPGAKGCSGTPSQSLAITITADGNNGGLDQCAPDSANIGSGSYGYYTIGVAAGTGKVVKINLPAGWAITNGLSRTVTVNAGGYTDVPWFGIRQVSISATGGCSGTTPNMTVSWAGDGSNAGYTVRYNTDNNFSHYWWDPVTPSYTTATLTPPSTVSNAGGYIASQNLPAATSLSPGTTYYVDVYYNSSGTAPAYTQFTAISCGPPSPPAPTASAVCNSGVINATINLPANDSTQYDIDINPTPVGFSGQYYTEHISGNTVLVTAPSSSFTTNPSAPPQPPLSFISGVTYVVRIKFADGTYGHPTPQYSPLTSFSYPSSCAPPPPAAPYFTTSNLDVVAGGGIGDCSGAHGASIGKIKVNSGGSTDSIVTAINLVSGFGALVTGMPYRPVCRPDLFTRLEPSGGEYYVAHSADYSTASSIGPVDTSNVMGPGQLPNVNVRYYSSGGPVVTLTGSVAPTSRSTLVVNGSLVITASFGRPDPSGYTAATLPTFGVVVKGDIYIDKAVTSLYGYYYATGTIYTCSSGSVQVDISLNATPCTAALKVQGAMFAKDYDFGRTTDNTVPGNPAAETVSAVGDLYIAPPPGFADVFVLPQAEGEKSPKF